MKHIALTLLLALAGRTLFAQAPSGYYDGATGKTGDELKVALHNIIKGHHAVSYGGLLNAFAYTDCKPNGKIWDIYSNIEYDLGSGMCGEYENEGDCWNREHTWPQSWFNEQTTPRSDLFHVYPTDGYVNYRRGNYPYGEVNNPIYTSGNGSKLGPCTVEGYSGRVFEPADEYKGDIARSYFYMSVRYYDEDSVWGTSGMTNKSEIKDWAMAMLLRWSDEDPVSQKEIDRNNAVYGYQGNRNPFIDHPEYAHIIWEEGWIGVTYNIATTSVTHGSITAPSTAVEGTMVTLSATPAQGYMLGSWNVYKTGDSSVTVPVSHDGTFTMPSFNVTVGATFIENNTYYNIALGSVSHGTIGASVSSAKSGTNVTLMATPNSGYSVYAWYVYKSDDINTHITVSKTGANTGSFVMPAFDVTVMATFVQGMVGDYYEKVTSAPSDWSGEYLIVYEAGNKAFNGSLTTLDATSNNISVTINGNIIVSSATIDASTFTITKSEGSYTIKSASGYYIGQNSNNNGLQSNQNQAYNNTIGYNNTSNSIDIISSGGAYLRYNSNSDQERFRYFKSSSYTNQKAIQFYKKTTGIVSTPTHTIHFYPNGGTGSSYTQTVNEYEPTVLNANTFTRSGYAFDSWNTQADGSGTSYFDGAMVTLLSDLTLYAQWVPTYHITCVASNGTVTASPSVAVAGDLITLSITAASGYDLDYLTVTDSDNNAITVEGNHFEMPASPVTVTATFVYVGQTFTQKYYLVTDASQLVEGRTYLIVSSAKCKAMESQANYDRNSVSVSISNSTIQNRNNACEIILGTSEEYWTLYDASYDGNSGGYLYAASSTANQLMTQATLTDNGKWSISIDENNNATIEAQGNSTHKYLRFGSNGNYFGCFQSGQGSVVNFFIRSEEIDYTESTTLPCLNTFDKNIIHAGVTLTAENVLGKAMCNNASQLIIEDGAAMLHQETGVQATLKKAIAAYSGEDGWYTIAAPFTSITPNATNGLLSGNYDLYAYDEDGDSEGKEWINHEAGSFNMTSGKGYLYANGTSKSLRLSGTLNSGSYSQTVNLSWANNDDNLKGFNLLGNPTVHEISFTTSEQVSDGYYYLNNSETWVYQPDNNVPVGRGFLVKANASGQTVTLNSQNKRGESPEKNQYLCVSVGEAKAYVKLDEGVSMPLMDLKGRHTGLYFLSERKPYAMLVRDNAEALDLCFETRQNGTQTLSVDTDGLELDYLHLIDHMTGADVDLLTMPNYTFEAKTTDYASRFRLVFSGNSGSSTGSGADSETFAYISDGEIIITDVAEACNAFLQVVDMTGRVITTHVGRIQCVSTSGMIPGVYVLRLITNDAVRVQKIEVR